ncbi:MAG: biopolymer transporter ExbD [Bacteroidota bacterium]
MADVSTEKNRSSPKKGGSRQKRKTTRIDMTAMVDVAFLLLAFFVLSATINHAKMMELVYTPNCPEEEDCTVDISEEKILSIVLDSADVIKYFVGNGPEVLETDFSKEGIRTVLNEHLRKETPLCGEKVHPNCWDPIFSVKASPHAYYKNLVDIMDELAIVGAKRYAIVDYSPQDRILIEESALAERN